MNTEFSLDELKIRNLQGELEDERDWRVKEFGLIKRLYEEIQKRNSDEELKAYTRMTIPIIYAHWEGFCVSSFKYILKFINNESLDHTVLTNNLFTYANKSVYDKLKGKQSFEQRCEFSEEFLKSLASSKLVLDTKINTKSNLNFEAFTEVCSVIGIDTNKFTQYSSDLTRMVNIRNSIAHGENSFLFELDQINKYITLVVELMDTLLVEEYNFINEKKYMIAS